METRYTRSEYILGEASTERLVGTRVAIFGLGGVGGCVVEALTRGGVGHLTLIDGDEFSASNLNRQILATEATVGRRKAEVAAERVHAINKDTDVTAIDRFMTPDDLAAFPFNDYDYIVDCIDSVRSKTALIVGAIRAGVPVISAMGAGNKLDPTQFRVADISKTKVCPLARAIRVALRKEGILHHKVVYSEENPIKVDEGVHVPGSVSFVPTVCGFIVAGEVLKDLLHI